MAHSSSSTATGERKSRRSVDTRSSCSKMAHSSSSSALNSLWTQMSDCAFGGLCNHTAVAYRDAMYVFGGCDSVSNSNDLISFGVKNKLWISDSTIRTPPEPRQDHSAVVFGNSMFIFGGLTARGKQNDLFEYDFQKAKWMKWTFSGQMPIGRYGHGAAVYDNKMWIYAGYGVKGPLDDMWALNLTKGNQQWEEVKQKGQRPSARYDTPLAVAGDCMYLFSGRSNIRTLTDNVLFEFNFKTTTWRRIGNEHVLTGATSQPPSGRYGHTLDHYDRFLYLFGGYDGLAVRNDLHIYDLGFQNWLIIQPEANSVVPSCRAFHASVVLNGAMYIYGGRNADCTAIIDDTYSFLFPNSPKYTLLDDYGKFFNDQKLCDIKFIVGPKKIEIMAHIAFVAARSKYLRQEILAARGARRQKIEKELDLKCMEVGACPQADNQKLLEVSLPNVDSEAFEVILNYVYTDRIDVKESYNKNIIVFMADIHQLADLFSMPGLAHDCIQYLDFKINKQNVLEGLCYADKNKIQIVKDHCMKFLIKEENFADVVKSKEFSDLYHPLSVEIMKKKKSNHSKILPDPNINKDVGTTLESDMAVFLESTGRDFCDINLVLDGQVMMAHKSILAARAKYFNGMFCSFMPPSNTVNIIIGNIIPSREALQSLLRYIYYGETKLPPQDALYLLQANLFYLLSENHLHSICKYSLEHNITCENVFQTLEAANHTKIFGTKEHLLKISGLLRELLLEIIRPVADPHEESCSSINTDN